MTIVDGITVHNFLECPADLFTTVIRPGLRRFSAGADVSILLGDIIIKWADDGTCKCVYRVTLVDPRNDGAHSGRSGRMIDLCHHKLVTDKVARAVKATDKCFVEQN